jgi:hypothetical protein
MFIQPIWSEPFWQLLTSVISNRPNQYWYRISALCWLMFCISLLYDTILFLLSLVFVSEFSIRIWYIYVRFGVLCVVFIVYYVRRLKILKAFLFVDTNVSEKWTCGALRDCVAFWINRCKHNRVCCWTIITIHHVQLFSLFHCFCSGSHVCICSNASLDMV